MIGDGTRRTLLVEMHRAIADAAAQPLFHLFALVDGVADPDVPTGGPWRGLSITEREAGDAPMWHDEFFETCWAYRDAYPSGS
jgi:hypothetical protein